jgi:hypothetical protein
LLLLLRHLLLLLQWALMLLLLMLLLLLLLWSHHTLLLTLHRHLRQMALLCKVWEILGVDTTMLLGALLNKGCRTLLCQL